MIIREYEQQDRQGLAQCIGLLQDHVASLDPLHRIRRLQDFDTDTYMNRSFEEVKKNNGIVYVAEENGKIIGCVVGVVYQDSPEDIEGYPSTDGKVLELIVLPEHRGQLIGKALM